MMTRFLRISATALVTLVLLALAACDSSSDPTSEPTLAAPDTVATPVAPTPTIVPSPTITSRETTSTPPPTPTITPSPTLSTSAATNTPPPSPTTAPSATPPLTAPASTPSPSPTERPTEAPTGRCGELCNYEFWQGGDVSVAEVRAELERGADVNARHSSGDTPLHWAVYLDAAPEIIRLLLDHGADAAAKDAQGTSILSYALVNFRTSEIIKLLLESGADASAKNEHGTHILHDAVRFAAYASHPETLKLGSETGRNLPAESVEIIQLLLEHGADASDKDGFGQPVLFIYFGTIIEAESYNPDPRVVELLLEHGAQVEVTLEDYTGQVMDFALWAGAGADIISVLLEHGTDATARGDDGDTLLHMAALFTAEPQVFELLLDNGADVAARGRIRQDCPASGGPRQRARPPSNQGVARQRRGRGCQG